MPCGRLAQLPPLLFLPLPQPVLERGPKPSSFFSGYLHEVKTLFFSVFGVQTRRRRDAFALTSSCVSLGAFLCLWPVACLHSLLVPVGLTTQQNLGPLSGAHPASALIDSPPQPKRRPRFSSRPRCVCTRIFSRTHASFPPPSPTHTSQVPFVSTPILAALTVYPPSPIRVTSPVSGSQLAKGLLSRAEGNDATIRRTHKALVPTPVCLPGHAHTKPLVASNPPSRASRDGRGAGSGPTCESLPGLAYLGCRVLFRQNARSNFGDPAKAASAPVPDQASQPATKPVEACIPARPTPRATRMS